jgi:hypothetical protein
MGKRLWWLSNHFLLIIEMYYPIHPPLASICPYFIIESVLSAIAVYNTPRRNNMIKKLLVESQLDCVATASVRKEVAEELLLSNGSLKDLLEKETSEDDTKDESQVSD